RRSCRRELFAIEIRMGREDGVVEDETLLGGWFTLEHLLPLDHEGVALDQVVAGAGRHVVPLGPDRRPWIVGKQRPLEQIAVVGPQRIRAGADGVADGVGTRSSFWPRSALFAGDLLFRWRLVESLCQTRLSLHPRQTQLHRPARFTRRLVFLE